MEPQPDAWPFVCLQGPSCPMQPSLPLVELPRPDHRFCEGYHRGLVRWFGAPAVPVGERDRLVAASAGRAERTGFRHESELGEAADFEVGPADRPGQGGALLQVTF